MKSCFVAMPISTPAELVERYENDVDHFTHVLEHLFVPAIERVGLKPISPLTVGSSVIHAEIIRQITDSDLVLCDMSTLNANVFFELGIRTALDRPVCLVLDDPTKAAPFDLNLVNHHRYNPSLAPWVLKDEVVRLEKHIEATLAAGGHNAMWSVVSLTRSAAVPSDPTDPVAARVELLENQVRLLADSLSGGIRYRSGGSPASARLSGKRILWVDDVPMNNAVEIRDLESLGVRVTTARSTEEAVEILRRRHDFDLILSDVHRDEGGVSRDTAGFDLLVRLREELKVYAPVIFYTSNARRTAENPVALKYRAAAADSRATLLDLVSRELSSD